ncbi:SLP1A [Auxenochlorella protothecoides x Auxenochlorella symbiontica]
MERWGLLTCLVLATCISWTQSQAVGVGDDTPAPATPDSSVNTTAPQTLAEKQYQKAISIRDSASPSKEDLATAVNLLLAAAGIDAIQVAPGRGRAAGTGTPHARDAPVTAADVSIVPTPDAGPPHKEALRELIYVYLEGDGVPYNPAIADALLHVLADAGSAEAGADVGLHTALGVRLVGPNPRGALFALSEPDLPAALARYQLAAMAGDGAAQMALGHRHLHGLGVPRSCEAAALYYIPAAGAAVALASTRQGLPPQRALRLAGATGGGGAHPRHDPGQEVLHYQWFADFGHVEAARAVALALARGGDDDMVRAVGYLRQSAEAGDAEAQAHLGHAYAGGVGVARDNATAAHWFKQAAEKGHPSGYFGLGYMHLEGSVEGASLQRAFSYFRQAADAGGMVGQWPGHADAHFFLGMMHLRGMAVAPDMQRAVHHLGVAARRGHILAGYDLAMLHLGGHTGSRAACPDAVALLKEVAERGWPTLQEAHEEWLRGEPEWALLNYLKAAEMGYEAGQSNAAWMLARGHGGVADAGAADAAALALHRRAAAQGSVSALRALGDAAWYGRGTRRDAAAAAAHYADAAARRDAQSLFNLGLMHAAGQGVAPDLHLARRCFDGAAAARPEAAAAVAAALRALRVVEWWREAAAPRLPATLVAAVAHAATAWTRVPEAGRGPRGRAAVSGRATRGGAALAAALRAPGRLLDALDAAVAASSGADLAIIGGLGAMLGLVLWRRAALRVRAVPAAGTGTGWGPGPARPRADAPAEVPVQPAPAQPAPAQQAPVQLAPVQPAGAAQHAALREQLAAVAELRERGLQSPAPAPPSQGERPGPVAADPQAPR